LKVGRNQPCPCGSGQKFKRCHGSIAAGPSQSDFVGMVNKINAEQRIRERQQGMGRPVIAAKLGDEQFVAVGSRLMHSKGWKTFPDFLGDYIKTVLEPGWGNADCRYQQ